MNNLVFFAEGDPEGDLSWMHDADTDSSWYDLAPGEASSLEPSPETHDLYQAVVEVREGTAHVSVEAAVQVAVVDWDEIQDGCRESLYRSYEKVSALPQEVPHRGDTLETLEELLQECPEEEVFGLHALVDHRRQRSGGTDHLPGLLVTVRQGTSFEYCHLVDAHWIDWDIMGTTPTPEDVEHMHSVVASLPESFPGRARLRQQVLEVSP